MIHDIFTKSIPKTKQKCPNPQIPIVVDTREKPSFVPTHLQHKKANWSFETLKEGDYLVGPYRIERKTIADFASSLLSKRLENQLARLILHKNPVLLLENNLLPLKTSLHVNVIKANLLKFSVEQKIPLIYTHSEEDTAEHLILLAKRVEKKL